MSYFQTLKPTTLLAPYVTALMVYDEIPSDAEHPWIMLPDTTSYICFQCGAPVSATHKRETNTLLSGLSGFQTYRFGMHSTGKISGVTVCLTAWGLSAFLGDAVSACTDIRVACSDLFPRTLVAEIEDRLFHASTAESRARLVEVFLLARLAAPNGSDLIRHACLKLHRSGGLYPVNALARELGLSERTLERCFLRFVGTSPKKYARILRLRKAIACKKYLPSWADIAQAAGYYDQSHLIRECQTIYGGTPDLLFPVTDHLDGQQSGTKYRDAGAFKGRILQDHLLMLLEESYEPL